MIGFSMVRQEALTVGVPHREGRLGKTSTEEIPFLSERHEGIIIRVWQ